MDRVFVSSVMQGFSAEREAAKVAIESVGLRPVMAETSPASPDPSRHALLPLVEESDVVVLILGVRYGFVGSSGKSPTNDEFDRAVATNTPVLVFARRDDVREPAQKAFFETVSGGWDIGRHIAFYDTPQDLLAKIVAGLTRLRAQPVDDSDRAAAQARAAALSVEQTPRRVSRMNHVRIAIVPAGGTTLIDALVLDDSQFANRVSGELRAGALVEQSQSLQVTQRSAGVAITAEGNSESQVHLQFASDGAVVVETAVGCQGSLGSMVLSYPAIEQLISEGMRLAQRLWALLPDDGRIMFVAAAVGVPEGGQKPLSLSGMANGTVSLIFTDEGAVSAPDPALLVERRFVGTAEISRKLSVSLKQRFADRDGIRP